MPGRIILAIVLCVLPLTSTAVGGTLGTCTMEQVSELKNNGFTALQIRDLCLPVQKPVQKQSMGQRCKTPYGFCSLYHLPPAPAGTPCYCFNKYTGYNDPGQVTP